MDKMKPINQQIHVRTSHREDGKNNKQKILGGKQKKHLLSWVEERY